MLLALARVGSEVSEEMHKEWPNPTLINDIVYLFRSDEALRKKRAKEKKVYKTVLASEWLDDDEQPLKDLALFQKIEAAIKADHELVVLISKGAAGSIYRWMIEAGLIKIDEV